MNNYTFLKNNKSFFKLWIATVFSSLSNRSFLIIIPIWLYHIKANQESIAFANLIETLAMFLFGFISGYIVDILNKKNLVIFCNILPIFLLVLVFIQESLYMSTFYIFILTFLLVSFNRIINTCRIVEINMIFDDKKDVKVANTLLGVIFSFSLTIGPLIAAALESSLGIKSILVFNIISFVIVILLYKNITFHENTLSKKKNFFSILKKGYVSIKDDKNLVLGVIYLSSFMFFSGMSVPLIFIFIKDVVNGPNSLYNVLITCQGAGSLAGTFFIQKITSKIGDRRTILYSSIIIMICSISYYIYPNANLIIGMTVIVGFFQQISMVLSSSSYQSLIPSDLIGTLFSFRQTIGTMSMVIGKLFSILLLSFLNVQYILIFSTLFILLSCVASYHFQEER
ncbi:MFS transporter [Mammaliicoccus sciuri]|uniref:MFS transporter n=1 Tax=Mammaliicoccus sciuri TaxID=1296 RepID=UPI003F56C7AB